MLTWVALPLGLQALAMVVDELYFHRRRGLPRWERIGHPIDTLSVLGCYAFALSFSPSGRHAVAYAVLSAFSCLLVTKDEWVHAARCGAPEQWLHAVLFVLHPIVLGVGALLWFEQERALLWLSLCLTAGFGAYQALYWNVPWKELAWFRSTTPSTTSSVSVGTTPMTTPSPSYAPSHDSETPG